MDVDFWGAVNGTKAFLPRVIASGDGHVVNISSLFGLIAVPGQSAYNACVSAGLSPIEKVVASRQDDHSAALVPGEADAMSGIRR